MLGLSTSFRPGDTIFTMTQARPHSLFRSRKPPVKAGGVCAEKLSWRHRLRFVVSYGMMTKAQRAIVEAGAAPGLPVPDLSGDNLARFFQDLAHAAVPSRSRD
jgi:hypothetical protein